MLIGHRQVSFCFGFFNFLATVLLILSATSLSAQTIEIKLVDGRNGHPMVGASSYVNVWVGGERKEAIAIPMDDNGVARLQLTLNPNEVSILDFAREIIDLSGSKSAIEYRPLPQDDPKLRRPDITRARQLLGWEPQIDRHDGLRRTLDYFRNKMARPGAAESP